MSVSSRSLSPPVVAPVSTPYLASTSYVSKCPHRRSRQPPGALSELRELTFRYRTKHDAGGHSVLVPRPLGHWDAAAVVLEQLLEDEAVEVFGVLCLTTRRTVICWHEVARGGHHGASFYMPELFRAAVLSNADAIIAAHNHPSGDPEPSEIDLELTRAILKAGNTLRIGVLDHLIIGCKRFVRLRRTYPALFGVC